MNCAIFTAQLDGPLTLPILVSVLVIGVSLEASARGGLWIYEDFNFLIEAAAYNVTEKCLKFSLKLP